MATFESASIIDASYSAWESAMGSTFETNSSTTIYNLDNHTICGSLAEYMKNQDWYTIGTIVIIIVN